MSGDRERPGVPKRHPLFLTHRELRSLSKLFGEVAQVGPDPIQIAVCHARVRRTTKEVKLPNGQVRTQTTCSIDADDPLTGGARYCFCNESDAKIKLEFHHEGLTLANLADGVVLQPLKSNCVNVPKLGTGSGKVTVTFSYWSDSDQVYLRCPSDTGNGANMLLDDP